MLGTYNTNKCSENTDVHTVAFTYVMYLKMQYAMYVPEMTTSLN